ncbi:hypothetical protein [Actinoplanes teichomyceticus]|uniref:Uncharacterized protein n=1 Tax=Actinoplanes teichomyceticus TaxID=1867 RepID=A0A561VSS0_ACTTI|nr:hypothetical protein [Actinoplanes teichomyceticus]TWG14669.1 hypothetical protein FHX34_104975 [Actinoplanes teichomyceticus]GIF10072.1 hypothetical protein Ate01nite_01040 [Actinoplanes teichomyceticus]
MAADHVAPVRFPGRRADRSLLRTPAVLLAVPGAVLAYLFLSGNPGLSAYPLAQGSAATGAMAVIGPVLALAAAWETFTLRSLWGRITIRRSWLRVLAERLRPVLAAGLLMQGACHVYAQAQSANPGWPGWQLVLLTVLGVFAWTAFGAALALTLGRLLALTAALLVPYLALTLPAGWEPLWLRHLNGNPVDCCSTSQVLDGRVVAASAALLGAILVLSLCVVRVRLAPSGNRPVIAAAVAVAAVAAAGFGIAPVTALGASPAAPRPAGSLECRRDICLWPEDAGAYAANEAAWTAVRAAWADLRLPIPPDARIGPVAAGGLLPITTSATDPTSAEVAMAQLLPRSLANCVTDFTDPGRDDRLDRLTVLLQQRLDLRGAGLPLVTVSDPQPVPADAERLWREAGRCP